MRASDPVPGRGRPTVGRDSEIATVSHVIDAAVSGHGAVTVVVGDPGIGKTTLLNDAASVAGHRGVFVLRCNGVPAEANIAFAGLNQLLRPVVDRLSDRLDGPSRLLRAALGLDPSTTADLYRVALATLELLADVATEAPVLLIADDAQWLDQSTLDVLAFIGRRVSAEPISVVAAVRTGTDQSFVNSALPQLPLSPLDFDASRRLHLYRIFPKLNITARNQLANAL